MQLESLSFFYTLHLSAPCLEKHRLLFFLSYSFIPPFLLLLNLALLFHTHSNYIGPVYVFLSFFFIIILRLTTLMASSVFFVFLFLFYTPLSVHDLYNLSFTFCSLSLPF